MPRRPVGQSKGGYVQPLRTPTFRDAMNGVSLQLDIVVNPFLDSRIRQDGHNEQRQNSQWLRHSSR